MTCRSGALRPGAAQRATLRRSDIGVAVAAVPRLRVFRVAARSPLIPPGLAPNARPKAYVSHADADIRKRHRSGRVGSVRPTPPLVAPQLVHRRGVQAEMRIPMTPLI